MRLLVQPGDGVLPLLKGIAAAKKSIDLVIFRFDQREVEHALANAVSRDVSVHALIAHTNKAGEEVPGSWNYGCSPKVSPCREPRTIWSVTTASS